MTRRKFRGTGVIPAVLLGLIVIYGASLRYVGQNWDDFTHIHPDERFLTLFVLPQLGGGNSFTADAVLFPDQHLLVAAGGRVSQLDDIRGPAAVALGVLRGSPAAEIGAWFGFPERVRAFDDFAQAQRSLIAGEVDALLVGAENLPSASGGVQTRQSIESREWQRIRCEALHPDTAGRGGFFDAACSPLNPHNAGQGFFVYGTFPLFLAHFASEIARDGAAAGLPFFDFQSGHLVWRNVSMILDILAILAVFALGSRTGNRWVGLLAALFYAAAPLAIQKAHFGTVNAAASFLTTLALYYAVGAQQRGKLGSYLMFGLVCGAAVASRVNIAPLAGIIALAAALRGVPAFDARLDIDERKRIALRELCCLLLSGMAAFLAFRVLNPYAFTGPGFFGLGLNPRWLANIESVAIGVSGLTDYPPSWQWVGRSPILHSLKDIVFWGMGLSAGVLSLLGLSWAAGALVKSRQGALTNLLPVVWVVGYFLFIGRLWAIVPRYYLPLYGALAALAGWFLVEAVYRARATRGGAAAAIIAGLIFGGALAAVGGFQALNGVWDATSATALALGAGLLASVVLPWLRRRLPLIITGFAIAFALLWGLMFSNVYRHQTTLAQATRYIWERAPGDFALEIDGADETVPLINIAVHNSGAAAAGLTGSPYNKASLYREGSPIQVAFTAPATGTVREIIAPHLGDPYDDPDAEDMRFEIRALGSETVLSAGRLVTDLSRAEHPLGSRQVIPLDPPLEVQAGAGYELRVEAAAGGGDVIGSGSVVLTEGSWDNHITGINVCALPDGMTRADDPPPGLVHARDCRGAQAHQALVNSQDQIMSYPIDNQIKYDDILRTLDIGDYLTIASNRFYDAERRNPMRFPLTTLYYEKLFAGELGYELVGLFDETFEFGPWRVSDQHLPMYAAPDWLNELEADESFHVYDHPAAFIFRKSDDYSRAKVEAILSQTSLLQVHELNDSDSEARILGVFNWSISEADPAPTALTFTPDEAERQRAGGAWSERFFSAAIVNANQVVGVALWYATIFAFGLLAFPIVFSLLPSLADGGYSVSKLAGMLLVAWLAWAASALKIPIWSQAGIIFSLALVATSSAGLGWRNRVALRRFLREHWKRLAWIEIVALAAFLFMLGVRLTNPDLWHPAKGGEKPMDFAYLNGVLRSTTFPPIDPWFAGGFINYYYFGYVLLGAPTLLLGIVPAFAYNLMIPTLFSLTGLGAFSAAFTLRARWKTRGSLVRMGSAWTAGLMALVLCVVLGNLDTVRVIGSSLAHHGGYEHPQGLERFLLAENLAQSGQGNTPELRAEISERADQRLLWDSLRYEANHAAELWRGIANGVARTLRGEQLWIGSDRWYWGPSRVLAEAPGVGGNAITEMPFFTFLYGDLHAHMISMPLVLLTALLLFNELAATGADGRKPLERGLAIALLALTVGLLRATNTWDWPSMTLFAGVGLAYVWLLRWRHTFRPPQELRSKLGFIAILGFAGGGTWFLGGSTVTSSSPSLGAGLQLAAALLWISAAAAAAWEIQRCALSRVSALDLAASVGGFLLLNLAFALPYTSWYASNYNSLRLWDGGKTPLWAYFDIHGLFLFLVVSLLAWQSSRWLRATPAKALIQHSSLVKSAGLTLLIAGATAFILALMGYQVALIVIPLVCWIALLFFGSGASRALRFTLVLIGLALMMTLGVEIIVIGGDIGRQNTVFKFYMQVWLLLSVAGGVAFACLAEASPRFSPGLRALWITPCVGLIFIAALFPILGTRGRSLDRMAPDLGLTLNGLDYMKHASHYEHSPQTGRSAPLDLSVDYQLIRWLQENVDGSPVIMEGRKRPSEYGWNGRISIATGLPSVLGWNFHQRQQRALYPMTHWVDQREKNILQFYNTDRVDVAVDILHHYAVRYIIRAGLEETHSTAAGLQKLDAMVERGLLSIAYEIDGGVIYEVSEDAILAYLVERHS